MTPSLPQNQFRDMALGDAELLGEIDLSVFAGGIERPDLLDLRGGELGIQAPTYVLGVRDRLHVVRIDAAPVATQVVQVQSGRNGSDHLFVDNSMRLLVVNASVPGITPGPIPFPASGRFVNRVVRAVGAVLVAFDPAKRLALHPARLAVGLLGYRGGLPAATHAKASGVRRGHQFSFFGVPVRPGARVATHNIGAANGLPAINTSFVRIGMHSRDLLSRSFGAVPSAAPTARGFSVA